MAQYLMRVRLLVFFCLHLLMVQAMANNVFTPKPGVDWQWQLKGEVNTAYPVAIYDIDLFDSSKQLIQQIQRRGAKVICYFSAGSYEDWREDAYDFADAELGNPLDDWPGERWVDIRSENVRNIMLKRLDLAVSKGCDGVEPDNVDGYTNKPGFPLTYHDQLEFNRFLAQEAHKRGLAIGLKNDLDQVKDLVDYFDFAVNEQCFEYNECEVLLPFIEQGKAVLNAEYLEKYTDDPIEREKLCRQAEKLGLSTLVLPLDLDDSFRYSCIRNRR